MSSNNLKSIELIYNHIMGSEKHKESLQEIVDKYDNEHNVRVMAEVIRRLTDNGYDIVKNNPLQIKKFLD